MYSTQVIAQDLCENGLCHGSVGSRCSAHVSRKLREINELRVELRCQDACHLPSRKKHTHTCMFLEKYILIFIHMELAG